MTKKIVLLAMLIVLSISSVAWAGSEATENTTPELLFRNIPWGTSVSSVEEMKITDRFSVVETSLPFENDFKILPLYRYNGTEFKAGSLPAMNYQPGWSGHVSAELKWNCSLLDCL